MMSSRTSKLIVADFDGWRMTTNANIAAVGEGIFGHKTYRDHQACCEMKKGKSRKQHSMKYRNCVELMIVAVFCLVNLSISLEDPPYARVSLPPTCRRCHTLDLYSQLLIANSNRERLQSEWEVARDNFYEATPNISQKPSAPSVSSHSGQVGQQPTFQAGNLCGCDALGNPLGSEYVASCHPCTGCYRKQPDERL